MNTYLQETVDIHQLALNLTYMEAYILHETLKEFTEEFQSFDKDKNDYFIPDEKFYEIYTAIMFKFMTTLIELK